MFRVIHIELMLNSLVCNFSGLFLDPFLNSGVMFASFHSEGTSDLLFFILIFFAIISGVTNDCPKCSDLLPSNLVNGTGSVLISGPLSFETRLKLCFHCCFPVVRLYLELSVYSLRKHRNSCCHFVYYL